MVLSFLDEFFTADWVDSPSTKEPPKPREPPESSGNKQGGRMQQDVRIIMLARGLGHNKDQEKGFHGAGGAILGTSLLSLAPKKIF